MTTTDDFTWGDVLHRYDLGKGREIVAYHPWQRDGVSVLMGRPDPSLISYGCEPFSRSWDSLAAALIYVGLREYGYGPNRADHLTSALVYGLDA